MNESHVSRFFQVGLTFLDSGSEKILHGAFISSHSKLSFFVFHFYDMRFREEQKQPCGAARTLTQKSATMFEFSNIQ